MKKAKIILASIMLFSIVGAAFAFKAARFSTEGKVFYTTTAYTTNSTVYTLGGAVFCAPTTAASYWTVTPNAGGTFNGLRTTLAPSPIQVITLTQVGTTHTITIPAYTCLNTTLFTTAVI